MAGWGVGHPRNLTLGVGTFIHGNLARRCPVSLELDTDADEAVLCQGYAVCVSLTSLLPLHNQPGRMEAHSLIDEEAAAQRGVVTPLGLPSMN